jgi:hypothetical protein
VEEIEKRCIGILYACGNIFEGLRAVTNAPALPATASRTVVSLDGGSSSDFVVFLESTVPCE